MSLVVTYPIDHKVSVEVVGAAGYAGHSMWQEKVKSLWMVGVSDGSSITKEKQKQSHSQWAYCIGMYLFLFSLTGYSCLLCFFCFLEMDAWGYRIFILLELTWFVLQNNFFGVNLGETESVIGHVVGGNEQHYKRKTKTISLTMGLLYLNVFVSLLFNWVQFSLMFLFLDEFTWFMLQKNFLCVNLGETESAIGHIVGGTEPNSMIEVKQDQDNDIHCKPTFPYLYLLMCSTKKVCMFLDVYIWGGLVLTLFAPRLVAADYLLCVSRTS